MLQKWSCNFHSRCQNTFWTLINHLPWASSHSIMTEKREPKAFVHWQDCLFFQNCVYNNLLGPEEMIYITSTVRCQNTFWTLIVRPLRLITLEDAEKKGQNLLFTGKFAFFFKKLCFQQPLRCYRNKHVISTAAVRMPFAPLSNVPWVLQHCIMREKIGQNLFTGNFAFFSKICVFNNLLRVTDIIL